MSGDTNTEEITGDTNPNEEEAPEQETSPAGGGATSGTGGGATGAAGGTGGGPTVITDMGGAQQDTGGQQQTGGYDLDAIQQAFDRINAHIAQQQAQQQQQEQPSQTYSGPNVSVGDLFGMDRWQLRQLHRGRDVQLRNGETVSPTSRWSGRHLAHDIRTERRHDRRGARRDYMAQYYNPARKARYDSRAANRNDREASHYVNIGQYVSPYTEK